MMELKKELESMTDVEIMNYMRERYEFVASGKKEEMIHKIVVHEASKPNPEYVHRTMSETYYGEVTDLKDIGEFVNKAISVFKKSNVSPLSKIRVEIEEDISELVFTRGYNIRVINIDLHNDYRIGDVNE